MIAELTLTATKKYKIEYPDNNFSDKVIIDNFWCHTFDSDEFLEKAKLELKRRI